MGILSSALALLAGGAIAVPPVAAAPKAATPSAPLYHELPPWAQKAGQLNVGTSLAYPPYDFNTATNTTVIGFEPDLDQALSKLLGVPFVLHIAQFPQLVLGVASHRFDIAIDGVSDSRAREKQVDFVDYGQAALVILTATSRAGQVKSVASICGNSLAYAQGTYGQQTSQDITSLCKQRHLAEPKVVQFPDAPSIQLALESGRIAFELEDTATGGWDVLQSKGKIIDVPITGFTNNQYNGDFAEELFGVVVGKGQHQLDVALRDAFNRLIADGTYGRILKHWGVSNLAVAHATIDTPSF
jgi:polar amino acid transport system substrate-binding protein